MQLTDDDMPACLLDAVYYCREPTADSNTAICAELGVSRNATIVAFSDLHGTHAELTAHMKRIPEIYSEVNFVFVGDAIDTWHVGPFSSSADPEGVALRETLTRSVPIPDLADVVAWPMNDCLLAIEQGQGWKSFSVGELSRSIAGSVRSLLSMAILMRQPNLTFCLGNHEVDLLSGTWAFRSLQKSFLLNTLGFSGLWCHEYRDWHNPDMAIQEPGTIHDVKHYLKTRKPESHQKLPRILAYLHQSSIMLRANSVLFLHGGPCDQLNKYCGVAKDYVALEAMLQQQLQQFGFNSGLFSELYPPYDTLLAPKFDANHFSTSPNGATSLMACAAVENLVLGHTPLLGTSSDKFDSSHAPVKRALPNVIKLDSGLKHRTDASRHYLVCRPNGYQGLELKETKDEPDFYAI